MWIQSYARFGTTISDMKFAITTEDKVLKFSFILLFQDQTASWIRIVNGTNNLIRETVPIPEEEKTSVKPTAKARPVLRPSSTSGWDFLLLDRDFLLTLKHSKDPFCFQVSKFISRSLRHSHKFVEKLMEQ